MRKALLASAVTLSLAACAAQPPEGASGIQVQDLSLTRERATTGTYTVERGDTLYGIAWRYEMDFRDLAQLNGITPPYRIQPGQQLRLVGSRQGAAEGGGAGASSAQASVAGAENTSSGESPDWLTPDTEAIERNRRLTSAPLSPSAEEQGAEGQGAAALAAGNDSQGPGPVYNYDSPGADGQLSATDRAEREALEQAEARQQQAEASQEGETASRETASGSGDASAAPAADAGAAVAGDSASAPAERRTYQPVDEVPWQWPAEGEVINGFGEGSSITAGIDIGGQKGQSVKAAGPGIVVYAGDGVRGYGNLILLKHNNQFLSAYAHNDSLQVKENDVVEAGEVIATMGDTDAEAVKLHFEVRKEGQPQDPLTFLPKR
ncbi:peptidoglycan DD-metalloendopeptidase family protein [Halomonas sp. YLGW01]|uniref:peptidoglycan DD-metalloendopeptidase family protein n=1 Tax=Halomonas sp. YLGW01 TaxID=2773308 RepID=UPI001786DCF1|nr:peptidoglycan DD-metalloendopeptidase family protein [Halomonas sp. YLGW01]